MKKKVEWLKEWLRESASVDEVKKFCVFATSTESSVAPITIYALPEKTHHIQLRAHTCFNTLDLNCTQSKGTDDTPKSFIEIVKGNIQQTGFEMA